jgi:hypothetical protein
MGQKRGYVGDSFSCASVSLLLCTVLLPPFPNIYDS